MLKIDGIAIDAAGNLTLPRGTTLPVSGMVEGDIFFKTDSNVLYAYDGSAWNMVSIPTVIQDSEEGEESTSATTPQQAFRSTKTLETAKYLVQWQMELLGGGTGSNSARGEFEINDTIIGEGDQPEAYYRIAGGFYFLSATAGSYNFDFNFYKTGGSGTVYVRKKRLVIMKVVE